VIVGTLSLDLRDIVEPARRYGSVEQNGSLTKKRGTKRLGTRTPVDGVATCDVEGKPPHVSSTFTKALTEWLGTDARPGSPDVTCGAWRTLGDPLSHVPKTPPLHRDHPTAAVLIALPDAGVSTRSTWSQYADAACEARDAYIVNPYVIKSPAGGIGRAGVA